MCENFIFYFSTNEVKLSGLAGVKQLAVLFPLVFFEYLIHNKLYQSNQSRFFTCIISSIEIWDVCYNVSFIVWAACLMPLNEVEHH